MLYLKHGTDKKRAVQDISHAVSRSVRTVRWKFFFSLHCDCSHAIEHIRHVINLNNLQALVSLVKEAPSDSWEQKSQNYQLGCEKIQV